MSVPPVDPLAEKILQKISAVDALIADLQQEKRALYKLLVQVKNEEQAQSDVTRKNSVVRLLIEREIINILSDASSYVFTHVLFRSAQKAHPELKQATFRSYLHRMKNRGLITQASDRGGWSIAAKRE